MGLRLARLDVCHLVLFYFYFIIIMSTVDERLACWTQAQWGLGSNRSHDTVG